MIHALKILGIVFGGVLFSVGLVSIYVLVRSLLWMFTRDW